MICRITVYSRLPVRVWNTATCGTYILLHAVNMWRHDGHDAPFRDEARVNATLALLRLTRIETLATGGAQRPTVNMYLPINNYNDDIWARIKDAASRVEYTMPMHGVGAFQSGWVCDKCHSVDHPTGLCPFNNIAGSVGMTEPAVPRTLNSRRKAKVSPPGPRDRRTRLMGERAARIRIGGSQPQHAGNLTMTRRQSHSPRRIRPDYYSI